LEDNIIVDGIKYDILFDFKNKTQADMVANRMKELDLYKGIKVVFKDNYYLVIGKSK
jgi:hypothetical protein